MSAPVTTSNGIEYSSLNRNSSETGSNRLYQKGLNTRLIFSINNLYLYRMPSQLQLFEFEENKPKKKKVVDASKLDKLYYTITEVAAMFNVNASLLRFWEKEFPVQLGKLRKNKKGDRYFTKEDIEKLKLIFHLTKEKRMTLEGAREVLKNNRRKVQDDKSLIENLTSIKEFLLDLKRNIANE